ncbi:MAG: endo-1,3-alpha-glucanase family glycosylhydrolase [Anaerolineae bacterium]
MALYYAWFDENTWTADKASDFPTVLYNSRDREAIARHVEQARTHGIDAFVVAWYGPQMENNQTETNLATMLEVAEGTGFQVTIYFETDSPFLHSQQDIIDALRHAIDFHAQRSSFLRYKGKPVIFFWRLQAVPLTSGQTPLEAWQAIRAQVDPNHDTLWIAEGTEVEYLRVFDGHHLYSIAWSPDVNRTLSDWAYRVRKYEAEHEVDRLWLATVMPGYNDLLSDRPDAFVRERADGDFYRQTWEAAMTTDPDFIIISTWNEWVEGSYIEPSANYGQLYLDLTEELSARFKRGTQIADTTPPPQATLPLFTPTPTPSLTFTPTVTSTSAITSTSTPSSRPTATLTSTSTPPPSFTPTAAPSLPQ